MPGQRATGQLLVARLTTGENDERDDRSGWGTTRAKRRNEPDRGRRHTRHAARSCRSDGLGRRTTGGGHAATREARRYASRGRVAARRHKRRAVQGGGEGADVSRANVRNLSGSAGGATKRKAATARRRGSRDGREEPYSRVASLSNRTEAPPSTLRRTRQSRGRRRSSLLTAFPGHRIGRRRLNPLAREGTIRTMGMGTDRLAPGDDTRLCSRWRAAFCRRPPAGLAWAWVVKPTPGLCCHSFGREQHSR